MLTRRGLLGGLGAGLVAAPAVLRQPLMMPCRGVILPLPPRLVKLYPGLNILTDISGVLPPASEFEPGSVFWVANYGKAPVTVFARNGHPVRIGPDDVQAFGDPMSPEWRRRIEETADWYCGDSWWETESGPALPVRSA